MRPIVSETDIRRFLDEHFEVCVEIPYVNGQFDAIRDWLEDHHGEDAFEEADMNNTICNLWRYHSDRLWSFVFTPRETRVYFRDESSAMRFKLTWGAGYR